MKRFIKHVLELVFLDWAICYVLLWLWCQLLIGWGSRTTHDVCPLAVTRQHMRRKWYAMLFCDQNSMRLLNGTFFFNLLLQFLACSPSTSDAWNTSTTTTIIISDRHFHENRRTNFISGQGKYIPDSKWAQVNQGWNRVNVISIQRTYGKILYKLDNTWIAKIHCHKIWPRISV